MELKKLMESKTTGKIVLIIIILAIAFAVFQAGIFVGFRKASFLFNYGDNYYRNFGRQNFYGGNGKGGRMMMNWNNSSNYPGGGMMGYFQDELSSGYGVIGKIIKVDNNRIVVLGNDSIEKIINVSSTTKIFERRNQIKISDLKMDQNIVTIGSPDANGQTNANFIRVMPLIISK